jgi:hypothetical protein
MAMVSAAAVVHRLLAGRRQERGENDIAYAAGEPDGQEEHDHRADSHKNSHIRGLIHHHVSQ